MCAKLFILVHFQVQYSTVGAACLRTIFALIIKIGGVLYF